MSLANLLLEVLRQSIFSDQNLRQKIIDELTAEIRKVEGPKILAALVAEIKESKRFPLPSFLKEKEKESEFDNEIDKFLRDAKEAAAKEADDLNKRQRHLPASIDRPLSQIVRKRERSRSPSWSYSSSSKERERERQGEKKYIKYNRVTSFCGNKRCDCSYVGLD